MFTERNDPLKDSPKKKFSSAEIPEVILIMKLGGKAMTDVYFAGY